MPTTVTLTVTKGKLSPKQYQYTQKESLLIGRLDDCNLVLEESTVSRYHCLIDISPPSVMARDFGSLNGTYLNDKLIGQRPKGMSVEEARKQRTNEFQVKSGDRLRLGKDCEITVDITCPQDSVDCFDIALTDIPKCLEDLFVQDLAGFQKVESIGKGGMGEVWLVSDQSGKQYALKLMLPHMATDDSNCQMFRREAQLLTQLDHPNVVKAYSIGSIGNVYYILMEFCSGGSVDNIMRINNGKLSLEIATDIILQALDGLIYTHGTTIDAKDETGESMTVRGIVHRDFKPANILLSDSTNKPKAKVADFGLAKAFEIAGLTGHTRTGVFGGTPVFAPRQQIIDYRYAKPAVDVWAAAASYYYMLTGCFPKDFNGKDAIADALLNSAVPIQERNASIPARLAEVIDKALLEKPTIGFQTATELKAEIVGAI
ncbi:MAG: serine/threonine-protein kinase [Oscillospiraceae bacterium]|nr:serine/threonine-protein kinase [Oscillospiraceae bacterium]